MRIFKKDLLLQELKFWKQLQVTMPEWNPRKEPSLARKQVDQQGLSTFRP